MATAAHKTNWFAIWVSVAVVAIIALLIGLVVWMNNAATAPAARPDSDGINQETGGIAVGTGSNQVDLYFDFYCPHCQEFEVAYGPTIEEELEAGSITLNLHPVALSGLNAASGTDFSKRSANALYCVADDEPTAAFPFYTAVFATNPTGAGLTDEELVSMAEDAGSTGAADCIADRTWDDLVAEQTQNIPTDPTTGSAGTPTLVINDEYISLTGDPAADISARLQ
ncbi:DsbA family protein [Microbacterium invictum]|uniref:Protein-disulfide isomerase n=1 Tax=Microbacterium invictum TaxID=515415 RepID=A0AA40SPL8_9MICO|nr:MULTISPECIES: thioredoxin domain-containing protein [Microbacterium]MBB4140092.1 protein-disulfide isomerase [Microbacterium invictum]